MAMASMAPSMRQFSLCLRCVRQPGTANRPVNATSLRFLSTTPAVRDQVQSETPAPAQAESKDVPEYMRKWGKLDPNRVEDKRTERRLIRRDGVQPIGSRRRRAVLRRTAIRKQEEIPFEQLPYQCFQEARKVLLEDRQEKLTAIATQKLRLKNLMEQDPAVSGGQAAKDARIRSMKNHLNELIILADINDPIVKKKFEDGLGDMNKPIYRYLADQKWRKYKRLVLQQRLTQMDVVPDFLPALDPVVDIDLAFGRKGYAPGEFVDSKISEGPPRLNVQSFEPGEKLVSVVVVDGDIPDVQKDGFTYRCNFIASNIKISPTNPSIPLTQLSQEDHKIKDPAAKRVALPWEAPWANKGAPYHRLAVFVLEQPEGKPLDVQTLAKIKRYGFILRSFVDKYKLKPLGATLFRTKWDENMAGVMKRAGYGSQAKVEFKRKRVEPLPYKRRTERMR
ncbi:PEBP-like protein [Sporormia fimetaria CBS 119925]|uniref:Large ribosomal subunit protein mL38 n=1 Tax=Sporormia fimetaria CBS 119925 TaxID=1340428 RepID=A0A6A6VGC6_9PLEO|nr:PEBP-like protein [Sporormia fimetaria CBS 119925]